MLKISLKENMYGTYREVRTNGATGRFDFSCRLEAGLPQFFQDGLMRLSGRVKFEGVTEDAPMEGSLRIDPLKTRTLTYDFTFRVEGALYRFLGRKDLKASSPVSSMTRMVGRVEKDGVSLADVQSHFDLAELPRFLASFRVGL